MPAARTRMRTSPGPGRGSGRSWIRSTSGGPCSVIMSAFIAPGSLFREALGPLYRPPVQLVVDVASGDDEDHGTLADVELPECGERGGGRALHPNPGSGESPHRPRQP